MRNQILKNILLITLLTITLLTSTITLLSGSTTALPNWDVSGCWCFENNSTIYDGGNPYQKQMQISMDAAGVINGSGRNLPIGPSSHQWTVSGLVMGDTITFDLTYTTAPLVGYVASFTGIIDAAGEMSDANKFEQYKRFVD